MATYGSQHIDPAIESSDTFLEFYMNCKELLTKKRLESSDTGQLIEKNSDPAVRLAFCSRLDGFFIIKCFLFSLSLFNF
jgi:hypothetical protein